jgi:hypothetical protein
MSSVMRHEIPRLRSGVEIQPLVMARGVAAGPEAEIGCPPDGRTT